MGGVRWVMCGLITHRGPSAGDRKLRTPPSVAWPFLHAATQAGFLQPPCLCGWPLSGPSFFPSSLLRQTQGLRVPGPSLLSLKNLFSNKSQYLQIKSADFQNHCFWWQLPEPILEIKKSHWLFLFPFLLQPSWILTFLLAIWIPLNDTWRNVRIKNVKKDSPNINILKYYLPTHIARYFFLPRMNHVKVYLLLPTRFWHRAAWGAWTRPSFSACLSGTYVPVGPTDQKPTNEIII